MTDGQEILDRWCAYKGSLFQFFDLLATEINHAPVQSQHTDQRESLLRQVDNLQDKLELQDDRLQKLEQIMKVLNLALETYAD